MRASVYVRACLPFTLSPLDAHTDVDDDDNDDDDDDDEDNGSYNRFSLSTCLH